MDKAVNSDIIIKHRLGCQVFYILLNLMLFAVGVIYLLYVDEGKPLYKYLVSPAMIIGGGAGIYFIIKKIIRERATNIPAMTITTSSLILTRNKDEYNEIPFEAVDRFKLWHRRRGKNNLPYIIIEYKPSFEQSSSSRFERVKEIECSELNMMPYKIIKRLNERFDAYNAANNNTLN